MGFTMHYYCNEIFLVKKKAHPEFHTEFQNGNQISNEEITKVDNNCMCILSIVIEYLLIRTVNIEK